MLTTWEFPESSESLGLFGFGSIGGASLATFGVGDSGAQQGLGELVMRWQEVTGEKESVEPAQTDLNMLDRKSTRLNSSH